MQSIGDFFYIGHVGEAGKASRGKKCENWILIGCVGVCLADEERSSNTARRYGTCKSTSVKAAFMPQNLLAPSESPGGVHITTEAKTKGTHWLLTTGIS